MSYLIMVGFYMVTGTELFLVGIIIILIGYISRNNSRKNQLKKMSHDRGKHYDKIKELNNDLKECKESIEHYEGIQLLNQMHGIMPFETVQDEIKKLKSRQNKIEKQLRSEWQKLQLNKEEYDEIENPKPISSHSHTELVTLIMEVIGFITVIIGLIK